MRRIVRFCVAGTIGFVVDAGVVTALVETFGFNPYVARIFSFFAAATTTWCINRRYTFRTTRPPTRLEWIGYVGLMTLGAAVNYCVYAVCITLSALARGNLWLPVALGSISGLAINFTTSKALLFSRCEGMR